MKKLTILLTVLILGMMSFTSCRFVFKLLGLYQAPKPETVESIIDYCKKNDAYYDYLYMPINDDALIEIGTTSKMQIGNVDAFDKEKRQIFVKTVHGINGCPGTFKNNYQAESSDIVFYGDDDNYFWSQLSHFKLIDKREELSDLADNNSYYDFFLITGWAKMQSEKGTRGTFNYVKNVAHVDSSKHVCIILINYDAQAGKDTYKKIMKENKRASKAAKKNDR
jgi:hypothetical protein